MIAPRDASRNWCPSPWEGHCASTSGLAVTLHQIMRIAVLSWVNRLWHYALVPCPEDVTTEYLDTHHQGNFVCNDEA